MLNGHLKGMEYGDSFSVKGDFLSGDVGNWHTLLVTFFSWSIFPSLLFCVLGGGFLLCFTSAQAFSAHVQVLTS
jgi:hypothetical protein